MEVEKVKRRYPKLRVTPEELAVLEQKYPSKDPWELHRLKKHKRGKRRGSLCGIFTGGREHWIAKNDSEVNCTHCRYLMPNRVRLLARWAALVDVSGGSDGCWPWTGRVRTGYGRMRVGGPTQAAHRISWELFRFPIPDRLWVLHKCDNRACVNPNHLFLGTQTDNMQDMVQKNRCWRGGPKKRLAAIDKALSRPATDAKEPT